jgi:hypothetical protein
LTFSDLLIFLIFQHETAPGEQRRDLEEALEGVQLFNDFDPLVAAGVVQPQLKADPRRLTPRRW